eukprot:6450518-Pyramimonas_sp.AAC.1
MVRDSFKAPWPNLQSMEDSLAFGPRDRLHRPREGPKLGLHRPSPGEGATTDQPHRVASGVPDARPLPS